MLLNLTELSAEPIYRQISCQLMDKIVDGELKNGAVLEPIRNFARSQHVSVNTVKRAYEDLERYGLIQAEGGEGFFVTPLTIEQKRAIALQKSFGKKSLINNDNYTTEDLKQLLVLTNQFVTALSAAQLYIEVVEKRRLDNELLMARQIQANLLPESLPNDDRLSMAAISTPSLTVGGDFYDYIPINKNQHGIVIADACGKGLPAAMLISQIQAMLKSEINNGNSLQKTLSNINNQIVQFTPNDKFVTLFLGIYDERSKQFEYANAGHNFPILVRASGEYEYLEIGGPALGVLKDAIYNTGITILDTDNVMLLYTDGITETMNENQEDYGEERLLNMLVCNRKQSVQDIIDIIIGDLKKFTKIDSVQDDSTMLVLKT